MLALTVGQWNEEGDQPHGQQLGGYGAGPPHRLDGLVGVWVFTDGRLVFGCLLIGGWCLGVY